jgi:putative ABC transport system permease protein
MAAPMADVRFAIILRPLAVDRPDRLAAVYQNTDAGTWGNVSFTTYRDLRTARRLLSGVAAFYTATLPLVQANVADDITAALATDDYYTVLGVSAAMGRIFTPANSSAGANSAVVLSEPFWRSRFGTDAAVVGKNLRIGGQTP